MAVPYPPDGPVDYSQDKEYRISMATKVIEAVIDELPSWETISQGLAERFKLSLEVDRERALVQDAFLTAELDLEWTGTIVYERDHFRRPEYVNDPVPVSPESLPRRCRRGLVTRLASPGYKPSRTIHESFLALGGGTANCDVYWAMQQVPQGKPPARGPRRNSDVAQDVRRCSLIPTLSAEERERSKGSWSRDLVDCVRHLAGPPHVRKYLFQDGREADLYDRERHVIIEAEGEPP